MASDMFAKLSELVSNVELIKEVEEAQAAEQKARKRKIKKKKKPKDKSKDAQSQGPPSVPAHPIGQQSTTQRPTSANPVYQLRTCTSPDHGTFDLAQCTSPSALKASYRARPQSALVGGRYSAGQTAANQYGVNASGQPRSASQVLRSRQQTAGSLSSANSPSGPSATAHANAWRDVSPPKYTEQSMKVPELGTVPGAYQSPPWRPATGHESDPLRREIHQEVNEARFKHILAVPAHVLAQSLYHSNTPSDRARAKQLATDLKVARSDRAQAIQERVRAEQALSAAEAELQDNRTTITSLKLEVQQLQDSVSKLLKSHKTLAAERDEIQEQLQLYINRGV